MPKFWKEKNNLKVSKRSEHRCSLWGYFCIHASTVIEIVVLPGFFFPLPKKAHTNTYIHLCISWIHHPSSCWPGNAWLVQWRKSLTPLCAFFRHTRTAKTLTRTIKGIIFKPNTKPLSWSIVQNNVLFCPNTDLLYKIQMHYLLPKPVLKRRAGSFVLFKLSNNSWFPGRLDKEV